MISLIVALLWPAALVTVGILAFKFGMTALAHKREALLSAVAEGKLVAEIDKLKAQVRDMDATIKQINNARQLQANRPQGPRITGI